MTTLDTSSMALAFDAEFNDWSDMSKFGTTFKNGDRTLWNNVSGKGQHEQEWYNDTGPFSLRSGVLTITASPSEQPYGHDYSSGMLSTYGTFSASTGYFEWDMSVPGNRGFWGAGWLGTVNGYGAEVDVVEQPNLWQDRTYWYGDASGHYAYDTAQVLSSQFHQYGVLITSETIQYFFDRQPIDTPHPLQPNEVGQDFFMMTNLAVGAWATDYGVQPSGYAELRVDAMRAWALPPGYGTTVAAEPPPPPPAAPAGPTLHHVMFDVMVYQEKYGPDDAAMSVRLDGNEMGGAWVHSVDPNAAQVFRLEGDFLPGLHDVSVNFLNDYFGGNDGDRNLIVREVKVGIDYQQGTILDNSAAKLTYTGDHTDNWFTVPA